MESKTHPPRIDPIYDAGTPDESGAYPKHVDPDKTPVDAPVIPRRDVVEHPHTTRPALVRLTRPAHGCMTGWPPMTQSWPGRSMRP